MLTILYHRAGQDIRGELLERMARSTASRRLLLVPEQYSHDTERALCRALGNAGASRCEVLSFTRLSARVADVAGGGAVPTLDAGGRVLMLYRAMRQVEQMLKSYKAASRKPAFLTGLLASLDECRSYAVTPRALTGAGEALGGPQGDKLRDIGLIYAAYEALAAQGRADPRSRLDRLAQALHDTGWARGKEVWVWGFTDFTPQEGAVLGQLMAQAPVTVALTCDMADPSDIFDPARRTASYLERLARRAGTQAERRAVLRPMDRADSLVHLEEQLFAPDLQPWPGEGDVVRISASDPRREVEQTAAEILRLVREEGYRFRDIAVCARDFAPYDGLVDSVFGQYGVPVFLSTMTDVLQKPVLALVTAALAAAAGDYPYEEMFRYLKTGLTDITPEERDELENYVLTWDIKGGTWSRKKPWDMHPEGYGLEFSEEDTALVERLDGVRRRVIAPLEKLRKAADHTGRGRALALYRFLEDIELPQRLEERSAALEERGELKTAAEYRQLWDILAGALEQSALLLEDMELELEEFSRLFSLALSQYDVGTIPVSLDRVAAGDAPRMAGRTVKALFLLGADSLSIPSCAAAPGVLTDLDREALAELDLQLAPRQGDKLQRELTIAYETCALPTRRLYVSYARSDGAGGDRAPSFLYQRLGAIFPDLPEGTAGEDCRLAAPGPALELAGEREDVCRALSALPGWGERAQRIRQAAHWRRGRLSADGVRALYGGTVPMSATRLDLYQSCHFSHFMRFGLEARPRQRAKFRPSDYGTFIHAVLEEVLTQGLSLPGGANALADDPVLRRTLTARAADRYEAEALSGLEGETARFRYTFQRMKQTAQTVVDSVCGELAVSDFTPAYFELGFGRGQAMPPLEVEKGVRLRLTGFVDRVDSWVKDGRRYLRVVDYKTGRKSFDFSDVADGRGLQMLLYLFALRREGQSLFGPEELVPAGVLYVPARSPIVNGERAMTDEDIAAARQRELRRKGLVLDSQEVLDAMEHADGGYRYLPIPSSGRGKDDYLVSLDKLDQLDDYLDRVLEGAAEQLSLGNIDADPYWHDDEKNACRYCDYAAACHFEECCGDKIRRRRALSAGEFWALLKEKGGEEHGH